MKEAQNMRIESIKLKNFKVFQDVEISELPPLCVFVGVNGSGKTTLFDVFGFLKHALLNNVRSALQVRGGYKEVISRGHEEEDISIEIKFRMPIVGVDRLVTYHLCIGDSARPRVKREILRYKRGAHGSPYHFLDFSDGRGYPRLPCTRSAIHRRAGPGQRRLSFDQAEVVGKVPNGRAPRSLGANTLPGA
jgi:predicted ATPase